MKLLRRAAHPAAPSPHLSTRGVLLLTALSYWSTCMALMYLNRRVGGLMFGLFAWTLWTWWGFRGAWKHVFAQDPKAGRKRSMVMGILTALVALPLFPGFMRGGTTFWLCLFLLLVTGARAPRMRTDRDFYFALLVILTVGFWLATDWAADWTLWFYLGPAWWWGALALAWHYAAGAPLAAWKKIMLASGFMALVVALTLTLFFFAPRPPTLGFGFLPGGDVQGWAGSRSEQGDDPAAAGGAAGGQGRAGQGAGRVEGADALSGWAGWQAMVDAMRQSANDVSIPRWQRHMMQGVANQGQALLDSMQQLVQQLAWLVWRWRYAAMVQGSFWLARTLQSLYPMGSMRWSVRALNVGLRSKGCEFLPGHSLREHWLRYPHWPDMAHAWMLEALDCYGQVRFGGAQATPQDAARMRKAMTTLVFILRDELPAMSKVPEGAPFTFT